MSELLTCLPSDILSLKEVKKLSTQKKEQVLMFFNSLENNGLHVLNGLEGEQSVASVPTVPMIIKFLKDRKVCLHQALVVHNHPHMPWHGEILPSDDDITSTEILKWQLALLGIKLVDHIIICKEKKRSLRELQLYDYKFYKTKGIEVKRFLYCFLTQLVLIENDNVAEKIINALEINLQFIKDYNQTPLLKRFFRSPPKDKKFIGLLHSIDTTDKLTEQLVKVLITIEDNRSTKINPDKIVPFGLLLQKRLILN